MNPVELFRAGETRPSAVACGKCGNVQGLLQEALGRRLIEQCCVPYACSECGVETPKYRTLCDDCGTERLAKLERARFEKAKKVTFSEYWALPERVMVYAPGGPSGVGNEGYCDAGQVADAYADGEAPEYWYGTCPEPMRMDASDLIEHATDDMYEGARDDASRYSDRLQELLDDWLKLASVVSYYPDDDLVVVPSEAELADLEAER